MDQGEAGNMHASLVSASGHGQITVAIYVFCKSSWWSDDRRLLRAGILLFVPGIFKCLEKPWTLKNATATSIRDSPDPRLEETLEADSADLRKDILSPERYVREAARSFRNSNLAADTMPLAGNSWKDQMADEPCHLFADLAHPYFARLKNLQLMARSDAGEAAHGLVRSSLSRAFDRLYTKQRRGSFLLGGLLRAAVVLLPFADIGLFQQSRRSAYARADVAVTYALLCCTAALELVSACLVVLGSGLPLLDAQIPQYNLIGYLARQNNYQWLWSLASRLGCKDRLERLWCTAPPEPSIGITKLVYGHVARGWREYIGEPTFEVVTTGAGDDDWYPAEHTVVGQYRRFNDSRGQRTLKWEWKKDSRENIAARNSAIAASMRVPFDESVLLWHLATEFCYFEHVDTGSDATRHSRVISDYMVYLLFVNPDMLAPGARRGLFKAAYHDLEPSGCHVELEPVETTLASPPKTKDDMARKIIQKVKGTIGSDDLVHRAWEIADELMEFAKEAQKAEKEAEEQKRKQAEEDRKKREEEEMKLTEEDKKKREEEEMMKLTEEERRRRAEDADKADRVKKKAEEVKKKKLMIKAKKAGDDKMWAVIQGVWVEMLCFSAGRCRGYLHAKNLGNGGEYLSYVWLLLSYMGMETMPERTQRPELPVEGDMGALAQPLPEEMVKEPAKDKGNPQQQPKNKPKKGGEPTKKNEPAQETHGESDKSRGDGERTSTSTAEAADITTPTTLTAAAAPIVGEDNV